MQVRTCWLQFRHWHDCGAIIWWRHRRVWHDRGSGHAGQQPWQRQRVGLRECRSVYSSHYLRLVWVCRSVGRSVDVSIGLCLPFVRASLSACSLVAPIIHRLLSMHCPQTLATMRPRRRVAMRTKTIVRPVRRHAAAARASSGNQGMAALLLQVCGPPPLPKRCPSLAHRANISTNTAQTTRRINRPLVPAHAVFDCRP